MATQAWTGVVRILVQHFLKDQFSSEGEMNEFMDKVQSDYENPDYHMYCVVYSPLQFMS